MAHQTPHARVKDQHGDKAKLVTALEKLTGDELWVARVNKNKGLAHVSNAKLLRLHAIFTEVKAKFGTRDKLIDAIIEVENRTKDTGYRAHLAEWPVPRLWDAYKSASKRAAAAKKDKAPAAAAKSAKKAEAKPAAKPAKKAAAKTAKG